jgi:voltage-gated potassium channel Kch
MMILLIGSAMAALTVAIHALGAARWLTFVGNRIRRRQGVGAPNHLFSAVLSTATVLILLHSVEALFWALLYLALPDNAGLENLNQALYFSMITLTTLGYGDVTLSPEWALLAGMEAMVGITVFGLTTALLYAVVQQVWKVAHQQ